MQDPSLKGTKRGVLAEYRTMLAEYPWAKSDPDKLERFMDAAKRTLDGGNEIDRSGHSWQRALELNGIYGAKAQALKRIHVLPD
jgi:hypothetical protein